ncbi:gliding motility lipoprotein GldB [soil metagenome]
MKRSSRFSFPAILYAVILVAVASSSCKNDPLDVDVSSISVPEVKIMRFDKAFFSLDTTHMGKSLEHLHVEYGDFADGYINNIICRNAPDSLGCDYAIRDFLFNRAVGMRDVYLECNKLFPDDFSSLENELTDAYRHFSFYFPGKKLPRSINATMTGFNYNIFNVQGDYGISLEFYLGKDNPYYDALPDLWPNYRRRVSSREYMATNFVKAWLMNEFPYNPPANNLINKMVYEGKLLYLQKALLRNEPDSIITGYPQSKLDWAIENEARMWATMIEQKKVYSDNGEDLNHFTEDGSFTPGLPKDSPGKAGNWIGLRIVESFMAKNPGTTLEQLMNNQDGAALLNRSKYKPKF